MFSSVDFPQPEGPTRMKNSPSPMVKSASWTATLPPGNFLVTLSSWISAMRGGDSLLSGPQPLTAPDVSPATIRRWKNSTMMMIGMVTMTDAAAI